MSCGNKDHNINKNMAHACTLCKNWNTGITFNKAVTKVCIKCKEGECQFVHD